MNRINNIFYKFSGFFFVKILCPFIFSMYEYFKSLLSSKPVSLDVICGQLGRTPPCMKGLALRADGYETMFYKKDKKTSEGN